MGVLSVERARCGQSPWFQQGGTIIQILWVLWGCAYALFVGGQTGEPTQMHGLGLGAGHFTASSPDS